MSKTKEHKFTLVVKTDSTRRDAELSVLAAFAGRQPDGCEFHLRKPQPEKVVYEISYRDRKRGPGWYFWCRYESIIQAKRACDKLAKSCDKLRLLKVTTTETQEVVK